MIACKKKIDHTNSEKSLDPVIGYWESGLCFKSDGTYFRQTEDEVFKGVWRRRPEKLWRLDCSDAELETLNKGVLGVLLPTVRPIYEFSVSKPKREVGIWVEVINGGMYETRQDESSWEEGVIYTIEEDTLIQSLDCYSNHYKRLTKPAEQDAAGNPLPVE